MNDKERGKKMVEEMVLDILTDAYPQITGRSLSELYPSESPDFIGRLENKKIGVELAEVRDTTDGDDYFLEAWRIADKKNTSYRKNNRFAIPIILVLHSEKPPLFDIKDELAQAYLEDFKDFDFFEIWLMDLSDEYYSARDPRRPADLFCLKPESWRGFHRVGEEYYRKPFG